MTTSRQENIRRERVKLVEALLSRSADTSVRADVALEWRAVEHRGNADAVGQGAVDLRVCAEATLNALHELLGGRVHFRLMGVKSVKAFDDSVAIVALSVQEHDTLGADHRLIGTASAADRELAEGVARAILNATNRVLENFLPPASG
ncbi:MAG: hypothetical protein JSU87_09995 [Gemmatimonadota bacterium]|nr:MAG: hypothetical protein JSU87_09995 [Gemmatimonadota bacterium]